MVSEPVETHYHRLERHRSDKAAERGAVVAELLRPRAPYDRRSGYKFIGLGRALRELFDGIRRRREEESRTITESTYRIHGETGERDVVIGLNPSAGQLEVVVE